MMNKKYPKLRVMAQNGMMLLRESIHLTFFMPCDQSIAGPATAKALDTYIQAIGSAQTLGLFPDEEGEWQPLDDKELASTREKFQGQTGCWVILKSRDPIDERFAVTYRSWTHVRLPSEGGANSICAVSFLLPTEFMEEQGPRRIRELAMALAASLPFSSGYGGLVFNCELDLLSVPDIVRPLCFRYPGMDFIEISILSRYMGDRLRASSWLTFLGPVAVEQLGGVQRLREHLTAPETHVEELQPGHVLISLGEWPEAGDTRQGDTLPAYRELARILEPRLFHQPDFRNYLFPPEEWRRWERRFLD